MIAVQKNGEFLPVLTPLTSATNLAASVDGTIAHAESGILPEGVYRISVVSSVDDSGLRVKLNGPGVTDTATVSTGMFMSNGSVEYIAVPEGSHLSVINGILNVVRLN